MSFRWYYLLSIVLAQCPVHSQQAFLSLIHLSDRGKIFVPHSSSEAPLNSLSTSSRLYCCQRCNEMRLCRSFVYDDVSFVCQLYQSDLTSGAIVAIAGSTTFVGTIQYTPQLYVNYNQTCDLCQVDRYLICQNGVRQCPTLTYWNGQMCQNKLNYDEPCTSPVQCRDDLNLTCVFHVCRPNSFLCGVGETIITFDDIPNADPAQGTIPNYYGGLIWTNGHYLNISTFPSGGYSTACVSGKYVGFCNPTTSFALPLTNQTFTFNSIIMASGWSDAMNVTVTGYYRNTSKYSSVFPVNTTTRILLELDWPGLDRVDLKPSGLGYTDVGMDNLCITF